MESTTPAPAVHPRYLAIVSAVALVGFVLIFVEAGSFGRAARLFPRVVSTLGGVCAAVVLIQSLMRLRTYVAQPGVATAALSRSDIFISYIGPIVYACAMYVFGFWLSSLVCLAGLMLLLGERRYLLIGLLTVGTLLTIYVVFEWGFSIRMPAGLIVEAIRA